MGCVCSRLLPSHARRRASHRLRSRLRLLTAAERAEVRAVFLNRLRYKSNKEEVEVPVLAPKSRCQCWPRRAFLSPLHLSHVWSTGQDKMRIVKRRLVEMMPDARVFLATWTTVLRMENNAPPYSSTAPRATSLPARHRKKLKELRKGS